MSLLLILGSQMTAAQHLKGNQFFSWSQQKGKKQKDLLPLCTEIFMKMLRLLGWSESTPSINKEHQYLMTLVSKEGHLFCFYFLLFWDIPVTIFSSKWHSEHGSEDWMKKREFVSCWRNPLSWEGAEQLWEPVLNPLHGHFHGILAVAELKSYFFQKDQGFLK